MDEELGLYLERKLKGVYYVLLKMGAKKEDAEDILQETAYRFVQLLDGVDERYIDAWLYRVAINLFYDGLKKQKTMDRYLALFKTEDLLNLYTPEQSLIDGEFVKQMKIAMSKLRPKDTELLLLKYSAEFSLKDMAHLLETTDKSIKTQLARAKKRLRKMIEEDTYYE
ncbi:RNA polymerase sigma factor [Sporosarcina sp. FSL K6-1508]|uniref:RNA polymerase sigma factor n=1 Tax=Sporosarcina sp. FSL K6-1508 TaxID=2921553 RepID=UPI0030F7FFA9